MPRTKLPPPVPLHLFDRQASAYDSWFTKDPGRLQFPGEVAALSLLVEALPRPWLEVGTGTGRFAEAMGVDIGLDPSRSMLLRAHKQRVPVVLGTGGQLPFRDRTFGGVLLIATLCFVADPKPLLQEARRVLREDGGVILADIPKESPWGRHYQQLGQQGRRMYRYARFYSLRELEDLLQAAGFRVVERACSIVQPPTRVAQQERGWWGHSQVASFAALLAFKAG